MKTTKFEILTGNKITTQHIVDVLNIESQFYNVDIQQSLETCLSLYNKNKFIYFFVKDKQLNKIVAGCDICPITAKCYKKLKTGEFVDVNMTPDLILNYKKGKSYNIYFSSIIVDKQYQTFDFLMFLVNQIANYFVELINKNILLKSLIADASTFNGERLCKLFNMKLIANSNHNTKMFEVNLNPPEFKPFTKNLKTLYKILKNTNEKEI